jgi:hypothetical protein
VTISDHVSNLVMSRLRMRMSKGETITDLTQTRTLTRLDVLKTTVNNSPYQPIKQM